MQESNSIWYQHEGLDRAHMLLVMLESSFGFYNQDFSCDDKPLHPSIWNDRCKKHLSEATEAIADLYQAIGEWE